MAFELGHFLLGFLNCIDKNWTLVIVICLLWEICTFIVAFVIWRLFGKLGTMLNYFVNFLMNVLLGVYLGIMILVRAHPILAVDLLEGDFKKLVKILIGN
jgi:hypothetical protein